MNPSIQLRMASMRRALSDIIVPALSENPFAAEQAILLNQHLILLESQVDRIVEHERGLHDGSCDLGWTLLALATGGPLTKSASTRLSGVLDEVVDGPLPELRASTERVETKIDELLEALWTDGDVQARNAASKAAVKTGAAAAISECRFFAAAGFSGGEVD